MTQITAPTLLNSDWIKYLTHLLISPNPAERFAEFEGVDPLITAHLRGHEVMISKFFTIPTSIILYLLLKKITYINTIRHYPPFL